MEWRRGGSGAASVARRDRGARGFACRVLLGAYVPAALGPIWGRSGAGRCGVVAVFHCQGEVRGAIGWPTAGGPRPHAARAVAVCRCLAADISRGQETVHPQRARRALGHFPGSSPGMGATAGWGRPLRRLRWETCSLRPRAESLADKRSSRDQAGLV